MLVKYDNHAIGWDLATTVDSFKKQADSWQRRDTVYGWLEERRMALIKPLVASFPECSWLTVGDGRFGLDASWIRSNGCRYVHATDMDDTLLKIGHEKGFVRTFSAANAEKLEFGDESFDFVLCKDALHHCPRPYHALYEMLRVSRSCAVVIEPVDLSQDHLFEVIGNYIYKLSLHEYEKFLLGMHYRWFGYKGYNDCHFDGVESCPLSGGSEQDISLRDKVFSTIKVADEACLVGRAKYPWAVVLLFKAPPSVYMQSALTEDGFVIKELPRNPYVRRFAF